jgi:hypothetical protein
MVVHAKSGYMGLVTSHVIVGTRVRRAGAIRIGFGEVFGRFASNGTL